ncbi:MAG: tetratricopeptide repeat protein, partial [Planctomycetota bacterium]
MFDHTRQKSSPAIPTTRAAVLLGAAIAVVSSGGCNAVRTQAKNSEGVRLYQQGDYQQAATRFQQAINNSPDDADGYYNLAASMHKLGALYNRPDDLRQAEVLYNQCLERDGNHTECYRGLAVLLSETDRQ